MISEMVQAELEALAKPAGISEEANYGVSLYVTA